LSDQFFSVENLERFWSGAGAPSLEVVKGFVGLILALTGWVGATLAEQLIEGEDLAAPAYQKLMAAAVRDVTGVDISSSMSARVGDRSSRTAAANAIGKALLDVIASGSGGAAGQQLAPSSAGAEQYVTFVTQMALEGWLQGVIGELVSLGAVENLGDLDDTLAQVLGLGRMSRRVIGPLLNARVVTPFQWHVNKTYRPELLSPGDVSKQVARGRWSREKGIEELARQGWTDERIEALFNSAAKFHSVADLDLLVRAGQMSRDGALQHLRDQGYDEEIADTELELERIKRIATFERQLIAAAVTAYVDRRIDRGKLIGFVDGNTLDDQEAAQLLEIADARRAMNTKTLSPAEARACVKAGILAVRDYRATLEADGYDDASVLSLELLLRHEIDEKADAEELRRVADEERAAEKATRDEERAARKAEIAETRLLARRGDEADLERAAVRGLVTLARYEEVIAPRYDSDTVSIMVELVDDAREAYLDRQAKAEAAELRAKNRNLDIGAVQAAVLEGVLSLAEFERHPSLATITPADRDILVATLRERLKDREASDKTRADAAAAARRKPIDLNRFEQLVRRGVRTLAQYDALLKDLDMSEAARADMRALLELKIADDEKARAKRADVEIELNSRGLSLEQFRRAVILGQKTSADYEGFIRGAGYTTDVQRLLVAEVVIDIDEADAARRRREQAERVVEASRLPLATVRRAARLGVITPAAYEARLRTDGYTEDDIAIETELLLLEIADVQAQRAGDVPIDPALASDEAQLDTDAEDRRATILEETKTRALSLSQVEELVLNDLKSVDEFFDDVLAMGYAADDAELLTMLVLKQLEKKAAKADSA
jgi:hypothetical protein